jgi:hypothetical protein
MKRNPDVQSRDVFHKFHHGAKTSIWPAEKRVRVEIPDRWVCAGPGILVWYLSDKLLEDADGKRLEAYEHEFESAVSVYYPESEYEGESYLLPRVPQEWVILGVCQGWALRAEEDNNPAEVEVDHSKLLWDERTKTLGVLDELAGELSCLMFGGSLRITKDGIEG